MKHRSLLLLSAPLLAAAAVAAVDVQFKPAASTRLTKVFTNETHLTLDDMSVQLNGEEMEMEMKMEVSAKTRAVVSDVFAAVSDGRPTKLTRTYDDLSSTGTVSMSNSMMGAMDQDLKGSSKLEDKTVEFTWSDADGDYDVAFPAGVSDDSELLEGLSEDMDLRRMLPSKTSPSEGDSWRLDNDELVQLLAPGGNMKILPEDVSNQVGMMPGPSAGMGDLADMMGEVQGTALATYKGTRDVDGISVAVIHLRVDITGANDLRELLQEAVDKMDPPEGFGDMEMNYESADIEFELKGEGELLWDVRSGHMHRFEFAGDMRTSMDVTVSVSMMGQDMESETSLEMSGTLKLGASVQRD